MKHNFEMDDFQGLLTWTLFICRCIPEFRGPMSVQPQEYPNYGKNACALICIHSTPPVVSIANSNGNIYHALLLPVTDEENLNEVS